MIGESLPRLTLALVVILGLPVAAAALPAPEVFVRTQIDELAGVLQGGRADRFEVVRDRVRAVADFEGFAQKALGKTWETLPGAEQRRFKDALQALLESHYLNKPGAIFDTKKVAVKEARTYGEGAEVIAAIKRKDVDVGLEIRVHRGASGWIVDDVVIDGLSLLEDYRAQFQSYLKKKSLTQLIDRLNSKAAANLARRT